MRSNFLIPVDPFGLTICMLVEHYILTQDPQWIPVFTFIRTHNIEFSAHVNRTRFSLDPTADYYLEFVLRWADSCPRVDPALDPQTGF